MQIMSNRLDRAFEMHRQEYEEKALEVLRSGYYISGRETKLFEEEFADYLGGGYVEGVSCGLDAMRIALHLLGIGKGDEVILQGNTFIAAVLAVIQTGATPVLIDPEENFCLSASGIEKAITKKTKAVVVTHLYGMMTPMNLIVSLCKKHGLLLLEDAAQAHGADANGQKAGTFGDAGCFSFYPTKNLGGFGDGGAIFVKDRGLANKINIYKNYGSNQKYHNVMSGVNSRLDEIQAGLLRIRLRHLEEITVLKIHAADYYCNNLNNPLILLPDPAPETRCVWHQYVVRCKTRNNLAEYLLERGIHTDIHYPIPPHLTAACRCLGKQRGDLPVTEHLSDTILSIPLYTGISREEQDIVIEALNSYYAAP